MTSVKNIIDRIEHHRRQIDIVDEHAKTELDLYLENESSLYNQKLSILSNIRRRIANGTYDHSLAPKLWMYWVTSGAKQYIKEFGTHGARVDSMFNKATRMALAHELANRYRTGQE